MKSQIDADNLTFFESTTQIHELAGKARISREANRLIDKFNLIKVDRNPFYLSLADFEEILVWKLQGQYMRQAKLRQRNTETNITIITQAAFSLKHDNKDYEVELKLRTLTILTGVEIPVASAILTLCYPELYCVIDKRNWRQIYGENKTKTKYTVREYIDYLALLKKMSLYYGVTPQEIDMAIWQLDVERN